MENKAADLMKEFWSSGRLGKRISHDGTASIELYNTNRISNQNPELKKRLKEVDKKLDILITKYTTKYGGDITKTEHWDKIWKKYGKRIHGFEYESDKDEECRKLLELFFNILYGEMLKLEQKAFKDLAEAEKELDEEIKSLD